MGESSMFRMGQFVPTDEVRDAWVSRDLKRMLRATQLQTNLIDRHFLLQGIVKEAYARRADPDMASLCARYAEVHLAEFEAISRALVADMGMMPRVSTFQDYATVLMERGEFDRAIEVCESAKQYGLSDGTKAGFDGRIARIKKKQAQSGS